VAHEQLDLALDGGLAELEEANPEIVPK